MTVSERLLGEILSRLSPRRPTLTVMKHRGLTIATAWLVLLSLAIPVSALAKPGDKEVGPGSGSGGNSQPQGNGASNSPQQGNGNSSTSPTSSESPVSVSQPVSTESSESTPVTSSPTTSTESNTVSNPLPESTVGRIDVEMRSHYLIAGESFDPTQGMVITAYEGKARLQVDGLGHSGVVLSGTPERLVGQLGQLSFETPTHSCQALTLTLLPWAETKPSANKPALTAADPVVINRCDLSVWAMAEPSSMAITSNAMMLEIDGVMSPSHVPNVWPADSANTVCSAQSLEGQPMKFKVSILRLGQCDLAIGFQGSGAAHDSVSFEVTAPPVPTKNAEHTIGADVSQVIRDKFQNSTVVIGSLSSTKQFGVSVQGELQEQMAVAVSSDVAERNGQVSILIPRQNRALDLSGQGFKPGTSAFVFLYSTPTLLGTMTIDGSGNFSSSFDSSVLDAFAEGGHNLRIVGTAPSGISWVLSAQVWIDSAVVTPTVSPSPSPTPSPSATPTPTPVPTAPVSVEPTVAAAPANPGVVVTTPPTTQPIEPPVVQPIEPGAPAESSPEGPVEIPLVIAPIDQIAEVLENLVVEAQVGLLNLFVEETAATAEVGTPTSLASLTKLKEGGQYSLNIYSDRFTCMAPFGACSVTTEEGQVQYWVLLLIAAVLLFVTRRAVSKPNTSNRQLFVDQA